jgi:hypothetical protein
MSFRHTLAERLPIKLSYRYLHLSARYLARPRSLLALQSRDFRSLNLRTVNRVINDEAPDESPDASIEKR